MLLFVARSLHHQLLCHIGVHVFSILTCYPCYTKKTLDHTKPQTHGQQMTRPAKIVSDDSGYLSEQLSTAH